MARIRQIKPETFTDSDLNKIPPLARFSYIGMWCHADRKGRLKDDPHELKIKILPYDDVDFEEILTILSKNKPINNSSSFILRYEVKGQKFIQINNFQKHQYPNIKEPPSIIPAPYSHGAKIVAGLSRHSRDRDRDRGKDRDRDREGKDSGHRNFEELKGDAATGRKDFMEGVW